MGKLAYKITAPGMVATMGNGNFKLRIGLNVTPAANCAKNGFHCAENPLDCLNYYHDPRGHEIYLVSVGGDVDEDARDSKISCTELKIIREITLAEFVAAALLYIRKYPKRPVHSRVKKEKAVAQNGFCIAKGKNPRCKGDVGDILGFVKTEQKQLTLKVLIVDGEKIKPDVWYTSEGKVFRS